ncbi:MAG: lanthionine synthetase C family protein [Myxococcales bacterium]|nr:lanthionine synthetase C family protein [Myxococcales bacterium]
MKSASSWRPLLMGAYAERARDIVGDISEDVRRRASPSASESTKPKGMGHPWRILLQAYRWADDNAREDDASYVAEEMDRFAATTVDYGLPVRLYSGVGALTWLHAHLANELFDEEGGEAPDAHAARSDGEGVEAMVLTRLRSMPPADYDLIVGLVGIGVIGLEFANAPERKQVVAEVLALLHRRSLTDAQGGRYLLTPPEQLLAWQQAVAPQGYYNLGLAHGLPGVVVLAAESYAKGIAPALSKALASEVVAWLLRVRTNDGTPGYASWIRVGETNEGGRQIAWCYGGLGVAAAILRAAQVFERNDWRAQAIEIALACVATADAAKPLQDQGLCHGMAGNAHLFNRLYQATGDERLRARAIAYYEATIDAYRAGTGIGGYKAWGTNGELDRNATYHHQGAYVDDPTVLTGSSGVGLALLAAVSHVEPNWDRVLLVSLPPLATER